ncbi:Peptidase propeptide and YPEB domain protein [compost metagenome]
MGHYPGAKLLEAELEEKHDVYIYEVELLTTDGVVRELDLDASTGELLKDKED